VEAAAWLQFAPVPRKLTALFATLVLLLPAAAVATGCGGGGDDNGGNGNGLSTEDNLKVDQDRSDIEEFCTVAPAKKGDLYDRAFFAVVASVNQMILIYKKDPNAVYHQPIKNRDLTMKQLVTESAKKLNRCGKDGKRQAAELTQALQSG
jgi:hypothetical protein